MTEKQHEKRGRKAKTNESLRELNRNPATDFLWKIIDDFFGKNVAKCAKEIEVSRQRLTYILATYTLLPMGIFLRIQKFMETKNIHLSSNKYIDIINFNRNSQNK